VAGAEHECEELVTKLRALRWQAMDVRYAWSTPTGEQQAAEWCCMPSELPQPFVELDEGAMGGASALCEGAGLLAPFRKYVLKLNDACDSAAPKAQRRTPRHQQGGVNDVKHTH